MTVVNEPPSPAVITVLQAMTPSIGGQGTAFAEPLTKIQPNRALMVNKCELIRRFIFLPMIDGHGRCKPRAKRGMSSAMG